MPFWACLGKEKPEEKALFELVCCHVNISHLLLHKHSLFQSNEVVSISSKIDRKPSWLL